MATRTVLRSETRNERRLINRHGGTYLAVDWVYHLSCGHATVCTRYGRTSEKFGVPAKRAHCHECTKVEVGLDFTLSSGPPLRPEGMARTTRPAVPAALTLYGFDAKGDVVHGVVKVVNNKVPMAEVRKAMKAAGMALNCVYFFWPEPNDGRRWVRYALCEGQTRWEKWPLPTNDVPETVRTYAEWTY